MQIARIDLNVIGEYQRLKMQLNLTEEDILALREREFYYKNNRMFKRCRLCGTLKHINHFYKHPLKKQKVFDECKECVKSRAKLRRLTNTILGD